MVVFFFSDVETAWAEGASDRDAIGRGLYGLTPGPLIEALIPLAGAAPIQRPVGRPQDYPPPSRW